MTAPPREYGCHCDIEAMPDGFEPDGCVFDGGLISECTYAIRLQREGKGRDDCEYWRPIVRAPAPSAEPPAQAATDDLVRRLRDYSPFERQHVVHEAADTIERQAREIARWNELHRVIAEELDCDQETWPAHRNAPLAIGATFVLIKQRAERAEAERDALRECVRELVACADESDSLAAERLYGKPHTPEYKTRELDHRQRSIEAWKAARAKVGKL